MTTTSNQMTKGRSANTTSAIGLVGNVGLSQSEYFDTERTCCYLGISMEDLIDLVRRELLVPHQIAGRSLHFLVSDLKALPKAVDSAQAIAVLSRLGSHEVRKIDIGADGLNNSAGDLPEWIGANEGMKVFRISRKVLNKWSEKGDIRKHKSGSSRQAMVKYNTADIRNHLNGRMFKNVASAKGAA